MKQKLIHFFSILVAFFSAIPIANAGDYNYSSPTKVWSQAETTLSKQYRNIAVSDDVIYSFPAPTDEIGMHATYYTKGLRFSSSGVVAFNVGSKAAAFPFGSGSYYYAGPASASDSQGTIIAATRKHGSPPSSAGWANPVGAVMYYGTNPSSDDLNCTNNQIVERLGVNFSDHLISGRTDRMSAYGNIASGTGYLWFVPGHNNNSYEGVERITVTNGSYEAKTQFNFPSPVTINNNVSRVMQYSDDCILLDMRGAYNFYKGVISGTTITWTDLGIKGVAEGADMFILGGHEILAYSSSATEVTLYDVTDQKVLNSFTPFASQSETGDTRHAIDVRVSGNTANIYLIVPGQGAAKYTITASAVTNPVTSLNAALVSGSTNSVNVSWAKPSAGNATKYAVSYSSDGGSTWSTAVETTDLSYTFNDLQTGTYIFKVTPYYGGTSVWGSETTSNSVNVTSAVGAPISNLAYTYLNNTETNIGRQDITLTWNAPTGMVNTTLTGYKVYRNGSLLATLGADALTYTDTGLTQNYTYKVVPTFDGLTEDASLGLEVTTTQVQAGVLVAPIITETRNYEGLSLVEILFKMPDYMPYKPLYFNLYRDGKLVQGKLQSYNTLDESLVRASVETTVGYQVEAVYGSDYDVYPPIDSVKSDITTLIIAPRDWAKTGYILQEIYNVPTDEIADDKKPALFDNNNYYRQGQFNTFDKKWYIAQRADSLSKHDETGKDGQIASNAEGTTGGIVVFSAENADQVKSGFEKIFTKPAFENVGIAMDEAGTLFVRNNNKTKLSATNQDGFTIPTGDWFADAFERRITEGTFYKRNADGSYTEQSTKLDLTALWTQDDWIEDMYFTGVGSDLANAGTNSNFGQVKGRSDYYYMWGDVLSAEGGYLILSPSWTRTAFKVKIVNGAYVSHEVIEFNRFEDVDYLLEPKTGTENYGFKLDGRDAVTMQIRSNGYYGVHEWTKAGTDGWHPIYTTDSRVNNAGGTSIQAFGEIDSTGSHTGELFIITPQSMHSHNVGDFLISRATKENVDDYADEGTLMPSTPVAQYIQTDARSNSTATNANGNWFYAEKGTYASAMNDDDECVDIYQYVPGTRFARYRLIPSNQFPQVQPTLDITTAYNDDRTDITHFDGVATWQRPAGFGRSSGSSNAKVVSYLFEMRNSKNELVTSAELPELYKTDGTPVDDDYVYDFNYTDTTSNQDIDFGRYSVNVRVKYLTRDGQYHISNPLFAEDIHDYPAKPATGTNVDVFVKENHDFSEWVKDDNGEWVIETKKVDTYRVDLDFSKPDFGEENPEPVSYYTIKAVVNKSGENKGDTIDINDFVLFNGEEVKDGKIWGVGETTSQIPGTYDFENAKAPYYTSIDGNGDGIYNAANDGGSNGKLVLTWFHSVPTGKYTSGVATASNGDDVVITNDPSKWEFIIVAHYAARNTYIDKDAIVGVTPSVLIPTGVEVIGDDNLHAVQIYPIPAHSSITVKSPEAINSIVIYNEAGVEVININGDGETITTVNIEDLATGFYFVKVNNNAPVKIIKK